jgi:hypothetical protein
VRGRRRIISGKALRDVPGEFAGFDLASLALIYSERADLAPETGLAGAGGFRSAASRER